MGERCPSYTSCSCSIYLIPFCSALGTLLPNMIIFSLILMTPCTQYTHALVISQYGRIRDIDIHRPNRPPAFCFVDYEDSRDAEDAVHGRHGYDYAGMPHLSPPSDLAVG